jgi:hypothetical protein
MSDYTLTTGFAGKVGDSPFASKSVSKAHDATTTPPHKIAITLSVGTSAEALVFGDVTAPKVVHLVNLDATNYVEVATDSGMTNKFARMEASFPCVFQPISGVTYYLRANTAACRVEFTTADA